MTRRLIFGLAGLVTALVVTEGVARVAMGTSEPNVRWYDITSELKVDQMEQGDDVDLVFAGTSMAWQAFVPSVFDEVISDELDRPIRSYNAGLAGGTPEVMDRWIPEEVIPRAQPEVVIWGLSSLDLAPNYGVAQADAYDTAPETSVGLLAELDRRASRYSTLIADRPVLRDPDQLWGDGRDQREAEALEARTYLGLDGERLDYRSDLTAERSAVMSARLAGFETDSDDIDRIRRTVQTLRDDGIEVVLVELPVPDRFVEAHPNGEADHALVGVALSDLALELGVRFLQLTDGFEDSDFVDFTHLDQLAATRFSQEVASAFLSGRSDVVAGRSADEIRDADDCDLVTIIDEYGFEIEVCAEDVVD